MKIRKMEKIYVENKCLINVFGLADLLERHFATIYRIVKSYEISPYYKKGFGIAFFDYFTAVKVADRLKNPTHYTYDKLKTAYEITEDIKEPDSSVIQSGQNMLFEYKDKPFRTELVKNV